MIYIENISKLFLNKTILKNLSLTIAGGEILGLAGPSGSGKSTLLRCIQGLETIYSGNIICTGSTGFLFQDFQLFPHMTVLENIMYTPCTIKNVSPPKAKEEALALLKTLELTEKIDYYPKDLSGGQKQRVALARALILNPDILLCDEPTSGLDRKSIYAVSSLLSTLTTKDKSIVIASHDLDFLSTLCTRIILIKDGSIVLDSQKSEIHELSSIEIAKYY
ncbi:MAG: ATP-binding cassette domain-containing protein [Desulfovibrionaceae bacterium]